MFKKLIISIILAIVIFASGFYLYDINKPKPVVTKIRIAEYGEVFLYAPLYVADEMGYFNEENLEVEIIPTGGDEKTFAALLSQDAQFGVADPTFTAISDEKGKPGVVVASILSGVPFWGITNDQSIIAIESPTDLTRHTVATFPAPSTAYTLQKNMFQKGKLEPNIKESAYGTLLAVLASGDADIALELEPNVSQAVNNGHKIVYSLSDYYPEFAITGLTCLPEFVSENPETVQKVVNALQKSMNFIRLHPDETASILTKRFPEVDQKIAKQAIANMISANVFPENTLVSPASWEAAINLRKEVGDILGDADYQKYVITEFSENAIANHANN